MFVCINDVAVVHADIGRMGTLVKPVVQFTTYLLTCSTILWGVTMACDRLYALHITYQEETAKLHDEAWLRVNCQDPVFYANLKSHTDICVQVERNAMKSIFLFAAKQVMHTTYLCGEESCMTQFSYVVGWFMQLSTQFMVLVSMMALFCPIVLIQLVRVLSEGFRATHHSYGNFYHVPPQPPYECFANERLMNVNFPNNKYPSFILDYEAPDNSKRKTV